METTNGSITAQGDGFTVQNMLFTYNEEEQLENRINKEQSGLLLHVDFVPLYPSLLKEGYGLMEAILLGYIKFFLNGTDNRFYCTNEQLAELFNCSPQTISTAIKSLESRGDIELHKKIRAGGGTIRFITLQNQKFGFGGIQKLDYINNKKIKNKKINIYDFETFWKEYPHARKGKKAESKKYFNQQDSEEVMKQVQILKRQIKAGLQDSERVPACERWIRDFTPLNEDVIKQKLVKIVKWHLNSGGDMKERSQQLKETFGEQTINDVVKSVQQNNSTINLKFN